MTGLLGKATSYAIGYPINRQPVGVQVYHVHGSVKYPKNMVVTADDYFKFINKPDYFSKKIQTLIVSCHMELKAKIDDCHLAVNY